MIEWIRIVFCREDRWLWGGGVLLNGGFEIGEDDICFGMGWDVGCVWIGDGGVGRVG